MPNRFRLGLIIALIVVAAPSSAATIALEYEWSLKDQVEGTEGLLWYWTLVIHPSDIDKTIRALGEITPPERTSDFKKYLRLLAREIGKHVRRASDATQNTPGTGVELASETHVLLLITPAPGQGIQVLPYEVRYHSGKDGGWFRKLSEPKGHSVTALREAAAGLENIVLAFTPLTKAGYPIAGRAAKKDGMLAFRDWGRSYCPKSFSISLDAVGVSEQVYLFKAPPTSVISTAASFVYHHRYGLLRLRSDCVATNSTSVIRCTWLRDSKNPKRAIEDLLTERRLKRIDEAHVQELGTADNGDRRSTKD